MPIRRRFTAISEWQTKYKILGGFGAAFGFLLIGGVIALIQQGTASNSAATPKTSSSAKQYGTNEIQIGNIAGSSTNSSSNDESSTTNAETTTTPPPPTPAPSPSTPAPSPTPPPTPTPAPAPTPSPPPTPPPADPDPDPELPEEPPVSP